MPNYGFAEEARQVEEELDSHQEIVDELRGTVEFEEALLDQGWHKENTGISVQNVSDWKEQRQDAVDEHHFGYLLREIIEAELVFWKHHHSYDSDEEFIEDVQNGETGLDSTQNIVKTWVWLTEKIDAPENLESTQVTLGDV